MNLVRLVGAISAFAFATPALSQTAQTRAQLEAGINSTIKANGTGAITGPILNGQLQNLAASMATGLDPNTLSQPLTMLGVLTYGGVTLANSVTGTGSMVLSASPTITGANLGTPTALSLTNATGLPNAGLLNSSVILGSTNVSLGATATTLAGLTSVSATTFTGSLTGGASLDLPLSGGALTGAVTQILTTGGVFTADGSQFLSQTTATTAATIYHSVIASTYHFFDVNRATVVLNPGTTVENADGYGVYIQNNQAAGTAPNQGNAVGFFSFAVAQAINSQTFGGNFAWNDNGVTATGIGLENDISISGAGSTGVAFSAELQGNGTLSSLGALGFGCDSNQATSIRWSSCFSTTDGGATVGVLLGALLRTGANNASQPLNFHASNGSSTIYTGSIQLTGDAFALTDSEETCGLGAFLATANVTIQPINCTGTLTLAGSSLVVGASQFTANGSVATALSSVGPTGSHTTVQEWFTIKDSSGNTRYIPSF